MTIRTIAFNPIRVTVDNMEVPLQKIIYKDEDNKDQEIRFIVVNGVKFPIQNRVELYENIVLHKMDRALEIVEEKRKEKQKDLEPKV